MQVWVERVEGELWSQETHFPIFPPEDGISLCNPCGFFYFSVLPQFLICKMEWVIIFTGPSCEGRASVGSR